MHDTFCLWHVFACIAVRLYDLSPSQRGISCSLRDLYFYPASAFTYSNCLTHIDANGNPAASGPKLCTHCHHHVREQGIRLGNWQSADANL